MWWGGVVVVVRTTRIRTAFPVVDVVAFRASEFVSHISALPNSVGASEATKAGTRGINYPNERLRRIRDSQYQLAVEDRRRTK